MAEIFTVCYSAGDFRNSVYVSKPGPCGTQYSGGLFGKHLKHYGKLTDSALLNQKWNVKQDTKQKGNKK